MPGANLSVQMLDVARELLRARRGDPDARDRAVRAAAPMVGDLVQPGAGLFVSRGLELLDEYRAFQTGKSQEQLEDQVDDEDGGRHPMDRFVRRLLARKFGFYVAVGEPGTGKTTLALRLANRLAEERGYDVVAVGGLHPDDRQRWSTDTWIETEYPEDFVETMSTLTDVMLDGNVDYPAKIKRRVILLDDASLVAHVSQAGMTRALLRLWNAYRHLDWIVFLTARTFKSVTTVAEGADAVFIKRPVWQQLTAERGRARERWEEADRAYAELHRSEEWQMYPSERQWVYVQSSGLHYTGMLRYSTPGQSDQVLEAEGE